ncbi:MAG: glycosyltransferase family 39 protein, partial [Deltaproteobacteria bacterium]|nr:glycosyltransferase family 39 protein [Deltaproteobacteria bacterium]
MSRLSESKKGLLLILCLSVILKVSLALSMKVINPDGDDYIAAAQLFASGQFKDALVLCPIPFYPLLITVVHFFVPHWVAAARFISIASLVLALIPLYLLAAGLFDRRAAFWGCLAFALAPLPNECAVEVIRDPPFLFLFAWAVYFAHRALGSPRLFFFIWAALFSWLAVLFRIEGIILVPFYLIFLACLALWKREERRALLKGMLVWCAFPLLPLLVLFAVLGPEMTAVISHLTHNLQSLLDFKFLDNYHKIYDQLKALEAASPYPGGKQNLAEIARRFMPLIYFLGLLKGFVKALFPLFVIPLFWGFRHAFNRNRLFVLALTVSYLFAVYYRLIERDFIQGRFLFAPAFLLYPWIGAGLDRIVTLLKKSSKAGVLTTAFVVLLLLPPAYKCAQMTWKQDNVIAMAGEWLAGRDAFRKAGILSNESRIPFYAGRLMDYQMYQERHHGDDYKPMEQIAL